MNHASSVRELSRILFGGAQYRLEVAASLSSGQVFTALDLVALLSDPPGKGSVHTELKRLKQAKLVVPSPSPRSDRAKPLIPIETDFWACCRHLASIAQQRAEREDEVRKALSSLAAQNPDLAIALDAHPST